MFEEPTPEGERRCLGSRYLGFRGRRRGRWWRKRVIQCTTAFVVVGPLKLLDPLALTRQAKRDARMPKSITTTLVGLRVAKAFFCGWHGLGPSMETETLHERDKSHRFAWSSKATDDIVYESLCSALFLSTTTDKIASYKSLDFCNMVLYVEAMEMASEPKMGRICKRRHGNALSVEKSTFVYNSTLFKFTRWEWRRHAH